jgi:hypothetical protein
MAVRIFRLPQPVEIPMRAEYAGCKSWVDLEEVVPTEGSQPVLTEAEFNEKLQRFRAALQPAIAV